ncbi:site-specific integrase [Winogradskyella sp.]|nr:site-specific integrase [Winogradskyella sp.]MDC1503725.1 site-specific integrase [Winogradskyella sp.]
MRLEKMKVLFYLNKAKTNLTGTCPIYCRITYKKERKQFSTGETVNPKHWNSKKQLIIGDTSSLEYTNCNLMLVKQKVNNAYLKLRLNQGIDFNAEDIINVYFKRKVRKRDTVVNSFNRYLNHLKKLIGKDIKAPTFKKFEYSCEFVKDFIYHKFRKRDLPLSDLNLQFLHDFEYYLTTERGLGRSTMNKVVQRFRKPIKIAISEGFLDKDPFMLYKARITKKEIVFLSPEELEVLEIYSFSQPRLNFVKDLFVFSCYTGLAYNELSKLEKKDITKGFDGNLWINLTREKTSKPISVPLLHKAEEIIDTYISQDQGVFPKISNQKYNSYLKEIATIVGIEKRMTTHMARRTFASTVLLYNDVPMEVVSELLGHSSLKVTQDSYGKVVQRKISMEMKRLRDNI